MTTGAYPSPALEDLEGLSSFKSGIAGKLLQPANTNPAAITNVRFMPNPVVNRTRDTVRHIRTIAEFSPVLQSLAHFCHNRINHTIPTPMIAARSPAVRIEDDGIDSADTIIRFIASGNKA